ncbi:MAG: hypothetical protein K1X82_10615 [Bacteroidia bacterium]|nr:hypothetical protein [Bacteroidia bacterium]
MKINELIGLVGVLTKQESDFVIAFLSLDSEDEYSIRKLKLFEILIAHKNANKKQIREEVYDGKLSESYYAHIVRRLTHDILNILLLKDSSKIVRSTNFRNSLEIKRYLVYSELLYRRGLTKLGDFFIDEGSKISEIYAMPIEWLSINEFRLVRRGTEGNRRNIEAIVAKTRYKSKEAAALTEVLCLFNEFKGVNADRFQLSQSLIDEGSIILNRMAELFKEFPLSRIGYWYYRTALFYYIQLNDTFQLDKYSEYLLKLTESDPAINTPVNIAGLNLELAEIKILHSNYLEAIKGIEFSLTLFNPKLNNYILALQRLFLAHFHLKNFETCQEILDQAFNHPKFREKKYTFTIWNYYKACLFFKFGHYKEAMACINQDVTNLASDRGELFFCHKVLFFQIQLETGKEFLWSYELTNFRKSMQSIKSLKMDRQRVIFRILQSLDTQVFDFPYVRQREYAHFDKLELDQYKWNPLGFELIKFEDWFEMKQNSYDKRSRAKKPKS